MNKTVKRILALILAAMLMVSAFAACGDSGSNSSSSAPESSSQDSSSEDSSSEETSSEVSEDGDETPTDAAWEAPSIDSDDYDEISEYYYMYTLKDFYDQYQGATAEVLDVNKRYAMEAVAEAKLLEQAIMFPTYSDGGRYAMGRIAPGSTTTHGWGADDGRYQYAIVTNELIKTEDRNELKALLAEKRGTGTYKDEAVKLLTDKGYTFKDSYNITFSTMPTTWDIMASSRAGDTAPVFNTMDNLLMYDGEDREVGALAESWEVSEDGLTYTFKIRQGVKWADSQGREIGELTAQDFVDGFQHMCDTASGLGPLWNGIIVGVEDYCSGADLDFSKVGIEATDAYTLVYHLQSPCPYFTSMLHYNISMPLCRSYYESQGGKFGADFDKTAETYLYGSDPDHIAYCGAYLITNATANNSINYKANPLYWDAENVRVHELARLYDDGSDTTKAYNDVKNGITDQTGINASCVVLAKEEKLEGSDKTIFDEVVYVTSTGNASYQGFFNLNRAIWTNARSTEEAVSPQSEEERERTHIAINNVHFRRALCSALDRVTYNAQNVGDELGALSLTNALTPGTFVSLTEETTVDINGTPTTFEAGTDYGEIVQAQLTADGLPYTVYKKDATADNGRGTGSGFDGCYNVDYAKSELELAIAELEAAGVTVDASNPIQIDYPFPANRTTKANQANILKQNLEENLDGKVQINLIECANDDEWYYSGYYTDFGYEQNYEIFDLSGWSPDYMDPCSYLNCFLPYYDGYMVYCMGIYGNA